MNERLLTTNILKVLKKAGGFWFKTHGSAYQTTGLPDIMGCYRGRFVGFEVKMPGRENTLSARQGLMLHRIRQHGGYSALLTSTRGALEAIQDIDLELNSRYRPELPADE
jgi:penicillin-binding protein-related factor A (putative recombinase)